MNDSICNDRNTINTTSITTTNTTNDNNNNNFKQDQFIYIYVGRLSPEKIQEYYYVNIYYNNNQLLLNEHELLQFRNIMKLYIIGNGILFNPLKFYVEAVGIYNILLLL